MGRRRSRRRDSSDESIDSEIEDDEDLETIVVDKKNYGLRPRRAQLFTDDLLDEEDEQQSDFEDELKNETLITTVRHEADQQAPLHLYHTEKQSVDVGITASDEGDSNLIDFESIIEKTEIQVHKRKAQDPSSEECVKMPKRRGRTPKFMEEVGGGNSEFFHFLARTSIVEDLIDIAPSLDYLETTHQQETENESNFQNDSSLPADGEIKSDLFPTESVALENFLDKCEQNMVETEGSLAAIKDEPIDDGIQTNPECQENESLESVIENTNVLLDSTIHSWSGIRASMSDKSFFLESDGEVAVLKDNAPKGKFHYLIIPKENLKGLNELSTKHIPVIEHMYNVAQKIIAYPHHAECNFLIGFNAIPAMIMYQQKFCWLHLHVISDEMNFNNFLVKRHWNSIHSSLFIHPEDVLAQLRKDGKVSIPTLDECRKILLGNLTCHICYFVTPKLSILKQHISASHF